MQHSPSYWRRRYWRAVVVRVLVVAIFIPSLCWMLREDLVAKPGFLIFGALLAVLATVMTAWLKEPSDLANLSRAVHTDIGSPFCFGVILITASRYLLVEPG